MIKLLTVILIALVSPIWVPILLIERFCKWFHWPYLSIITWPVCIPFFVVVWVLIRADEVDFKPTLLEFLKMELLEMLVSHEQETFFDD